MWIFAKCLTAEYSIWILYAVETFRVTNVILDFYTCLHAGLVAGFPRI